MKFFSKTPNYRVILKNGLPGNPIMGTPGVSGVSVKFEGGVAIVNDQEIVDLLKKHSGFGLHFIEGKEENVDPFAGQRQDTEPAHVIQEMQFGHITKQQQSKPILDQKEMIIAAAKEMAKGMVKELLPGIIESAKKELEAAKVPASVPKKSKKEESKEEVGVESAA